MSNNSLHLVDLSRNSCVDAEQEDDFVFFDRPGTAMDWDIVDAQNNDAEEICQDSGMDSNFVDGESCGEIDAEPEIEKK
ncbi:hypothetical protein COL154_012096 [Colletotrichum chrysophilum]|nr:hypothetical protein KNSL1_011541 [Colletotrichum chrysophilum]KAJ0353634.1 hypothetical protein COL154_012096 [Colletotrichum chrysophilum]